MDAFIAMNKYIVREVLASGAGVPVAFDENIAKAETCRRKDVAATSVRAAQGIGHCGANG